jgi:hypothetical protein
MKIGLCTVDEVSISGGCSFIEATVGRMHLAAVWNSCCCKYLKVFRQCLPEGVQGLILLRLNFCVFSGEIDSNR